MRPKFERRRTKSVRECLKSNFTKTEAKRIRMRELAQKILKNDSAAFDDHLIESLMFFREISKKLARMVLR